MTVSNELRTQVMQRAAGAVSLQVAFVGVVNGLFSELHRLEVADAATLAEATQRDAAYVERWCDAAYAFGLLEEADSGKFCLSELGAGFRPEAEGTLMPFAINSVLYAHVAERAAGLMPGGERPGEAVLTERATIAGWFGPMLEGSFGDFFQNEIVPAVPEYAAANDDEGLVVDLGCGNGWYLRRLLQRCSRLRGLGLDAMETNIDHAVRLADEAGLRGRLHFARGDIDSFEAPEPARLIAMNRALHHVWDRRERVFEILRDHLSSDGAVVIWEPRWPDERSELRQPRRPGMAAQNLSEHVQGNHFLRPREIERELERVGLTPRTHLFGGGAEMVIVGRR